MLAAFPGDMLYAVKCNDAPEVLRALWDGGVRAVRHGVDRRGARGQGAAAGGALPFHAPGQEPGGDRRGLSRHGVRRFVFDHPDELAKIVAHTGSADDLELFVRLAVPGEGAMLTLTGKFGVGVERGGGAGARGARPRPLGRHHLPCRLAVRRARGLRAGDRAGGRGRAPRPARSTISMSAAASRPRYLGDEPAFEAFVAAIREAVARHGLACRLQCEPGRALVADGASVLARVELRRGLGLYLNDGVYGNLAELKWIGPQFPMRLVRPARRERTRGCSASTCSGPTCDSIDSMPGPHWLPADAEAGDWIEVGMMGAYSNALRTRFNGFASEPMALLGDGGWYLAERRRPVRVGTHALAA